LPLPIEKVKFCLSTLPQEHEVITGNAFKKSDTSSVVRNKKAIREIARERIEILLSEAEKIARENPERARRYVELALKVAKKCRVRIPARYKYRFCKKCHTWWIPGRNVIIRLVPRPKPMIVYRCLQCGRVYRRGYDKQTSAD